MGPEGRDGICVGEVVCGFGIDGALGVNDLLDVEVEQIMRRDPKQGKGYEKQGI